MTKYHRSILKITRFGRISRSPKRYCHHFKKVRFRQPLEDIREYQPIKADHPDQSF